MKRASTENSYIEWVVSIAVMFATTFSVIRGLVMSFYPNFIFITGIARNFTLLLLLIYQLKHYGLKIRGGYLLFFLAYSTYILLYITQFPVYKLEDLLQGPTSVFNFFYRTVQVLVYIMCAQTIIKHLNVTKYLIVSVVFCSLPTLLFIQHVGIETLTVFGLTDDDGDAVSVLSMGYTNGLMLALGVLFFTRMFKNKIVSMVFSTAIITVGMYIMLAAGERGPVLWTMVDIAICLSFISRHIVRYVVLAGIVVILMWINVDAIIGGISSFAPRAADRIEMAVKEGDTNGRFDTSNAADGSVYIIGWNMFASSPIYGRYFRLIVNGHFRGAYPHNLFIEVLMTMGLVGFIPFVYLLWSGWKRVMKTMKGNYTDSQLACVVFFLAAFLQLMTSSTLVFNSAFWCFFAIMCSLDLDFSRSAKRARVKAVPIIKSV